MMDTNDPHVCTKCWGTGRYAATEEDKRSYLASLWQWEALREKSNVELADMVSEIENYLRHRDLAPVVFTWLQEMWWRLQAADEPVEETRRKIDALSDDPEWLEKGGERT